MFKDIIVLSLVIFLVYQVLNRYVLPIFRFTTAANGQMRKMKEQMQEMNNRMNQPNPASNNFHTTQKQKVEKEGDYIDYEEIK